MDGMKKKITILLLVSALVFSVFGCKKAIKRSIFVSDGAIELELYETHTLTARNRR